MPATQSKELGYFEHTRLPFKHKIQYPIDMADVGLSKAHEVLEARVNGLEARLEKVHDAFGGEDVDPSSDDARIVRLSNIYARLEESLDKANHRLELIDGALGLIHDAAQIGYEQRLRTFNARKKRAAK